MSNKAAEQILEKHGRIDLLVNSAGINVPKRSWADMELDGWDKLVEINLNGVLYCMRAVLPAMRKQQDGCIINVASWAGRHVSKMPGPAYTTTKHAVLALTHSFNMDECVNGLRACCLSPGEVATPILKLRPVVPSEEEQAKMLQPEDCGRTIAFVASMPPRVCMNEILISPTHNRGFIQTPHNQGLGGSASVARMGRSAMRRGQVLASRSLSEGDLSIRLRGRLMRLSTGQPGAVSSDAAGSTQVRGNRPGPKSFINAQASSSVRGV